MACASWRFMSAFQSTLSVRRATLDKLTTGKMTRISIHALREESDKGDMLDAAFGITFQSTLSVRRATRLSDAALHAIGISIHALREESDPSMRPPRQRPGDFNPRSP